MDPSPDIPDTFPSADDPSPLQTGIAFVMTIQLPYGISGKSGHLPADLAGPIHTAAPIPRVRVGVTNIRTVLVGTAIPRDHPAESGPHLGHGIYHFFDTG